MAKPKGVQKKSPSSKKWDSNKSTSKSQDSGSKARGKVFNEEYYDPKSKQTFEEFIKAKNPKYDLARNLLNPTKHQRQCRSCKKRNEHEYVGRLIRTIRYYCEDDLLGNNKLDRTEYALFEEDPSDEEMDEEEGGEE